ncbi:MAG: SAM-dependent methyltransferase [Chlamydiia bacterium]
MLTGYLAAEGYESLVENQLVNIQDRIGRLFIAEGPIQRPYFAQNIWYDVEKVSFDSISQAAALLRAKGKLWAFYPFQFVRRGELISERLPYFAPKPLAFRSPSPKGVLGSWTMLDATSLYASAKSSSPFAHGQVVFQESKIPPSRAYLKLWEALTLIGKSPTSSDVCLEVGASPGSWTWALQQLGAQVIAVDKASLSELVMSLPRIEFIKKDAFALNPSDFRRIDWIFSDVICYPEKLLEWVHKWRQSCPWIHFVCTIKFQGDCSYEIVEEFLKIEGSTIFHLSNNKHELTWVLLSSPSESS